MYSYPLAGDIILCGSSWNVHAQRFLRPGSIADFSHAAVMCSINYGVQAMPDSGVDAFSLHEFLDKQVGDSTWKIYRLKELDKCAETQGDGDTTTRFRDAAIYFMGQPYNFCINLPERPRNTESSQRSFCSQLVTRIYEKAGIARPDSRLLTSTVLPADLQTHFAENEDWLEVTAIYSARMEWAIKNQKLGSLIKSDLESIEKFRISLRLALRSQEKFISDEAKLTKFGNALSSLDATVAAHYKNAIGVQLPPQSPINVSHLTQAIEQAAESNWQARRRFKRIQSRLRWREIWHKLTGRRN
nr:YiiX/YebB-like N1pC/P60 family cysteine hydrolase [Comamonas koreensis]